MSELIYTPRNVFFFLLGWVTWWRHTLFCCRHHSFFTAAFGKIDIPVIPRNLLFIFVPLKIDVTHKNLRLPVIIQKLCRTYDFPYFEKIILRMKLFLLPFQRSCPSTEICSVSKLRPCSNCCNFVIQQKILTYLANRVGHVFHWS